MAFDPKSAKAYGVLSGIALTKGILIYVGFLVGRSFDKKLGTFPLFMILGMTISSVLGLVWLVYVVKRLK